MAKRPFNPRFKAYLAWRDMIRRCTDASDPYYHRYGGRGINVCDEWLASFHSFLADMGLPAEGLSIDRIDNEGGYCKGNCKWATPAEQALNREGAIVIERDGVRLSAKGWSLRLGMSAGTIKERVRLGWPESMLLCPVHTRLPRAKQ